MQYFLFLPHYREPNKTIEKTGLFVPQHAAWPGVPSVLCQVRLLVDGLGVRGHEPVNRTLLKEYIDRNRKDGACELHNIGIKTDRASSRRSKVRFALTSPRKAIRGLERIRM
jgi:hypothetical protein